MPDATLLPPMQETPRLPGTWWTEPRGAQGRSRVFGEPAQRFSRAVVSCYDPGRGSSESASIGTTVPDIERLPNGLPHPLPTAEVEKTYTLLEIRLGRNAYPLRRPMEGEYQTGKQGVAFRVDTFLPAVVGEGKDRPSALRDFQCKVHVRLHRLLATFEGAWTEEERRDWEILESHLDLEVYLRDRPIRLYQRGEVIEADGDRWKVRWLDGREETLDLGKMPDDFAAFEVGEHFESFVAIHPGTSALIEMYSVHPVDPPDESVSPEEAWQHAIESAERVRLPHSTLDWTK